MRRHMAILLVLLTLGMIFSVPALAQNTPGGQQAAPPNTPAATEDTTPQPIIDTNTNDPSKLRFSRNLQSLPAADKSKKFYAIRSSSGLYVEGNSKGPTSRQVYNSYGYVMPGTLMSEDATKVEFGFQNSEIRSMDSRGRLYDSNGAQIGNGLALPYDPDRIWGSSESAYLTIKSKDDKTRVYGGNGQLLTSDGQAFSNGAWVDKSGDDDVFHSRFGSAVSGALSDELGGYYVQESPGGTSGSVWLHHYPDGTVYGESGGVFDSKYVFAKEDPRTGNTEDVHVYDECVSGQTLDKYACRGDGGQIVYGFSGEDIPEEEQKEMFADSFGIGSFGWRHFGDSVDTWIGLTSGRYASLFYSDWETDYYKDLKENEFINTVLGGIEGWSTGICEAGVADVVGMGGSFSPVGGTSFAHIESVRDTFLNLSDPEHPQQKYLYTFSMQINPADCEMQVTPTIINKGKIQEPRKRTLVLNVPVLKKGDKTLTFRAAAQSVRHYDMVCLEFGSIGTNCLAGVDERTPICNVIADGVQMYEQEVAERLKADAERGRGSGGSGGSGTKDAPISLAEI